MELGRSRLAELQPNTSGAKPDAGAEGGAK